MQQILKGAREQFASSFPLAFSNFECFPYVYSKSNIQKPDESVITLIYIGAMERNNAIDCN